jgi:predicted DsbA family dithiol-disulfide isomerase
VRNDLNEGIEKGVRDVPAFFVNGELVEGKATYENLSKDINAALKKVKKKVVPAAKQRA